MFNRITAFFFSAVILLFGSIPGLFGIAKINVDFTSVTGEMRPVNGIGRMPEYVTNSDVNAFFTQANVPSCRTHDIACTDIYRIFPDFSKSPDDEAAYDFSECDKVIEAIYDAGMEPFFRFGISYSDPIRQGHLLQPPTDYQKWAEICEHIVLHYNYGWADGFNHDITYWEIYNEPDNDDDLSENHFWLGTKEEFFELYDVTAKHIKSKFPDLKIGGYGSCGFYALTKTNALNTGSSPRNQYFVTFFDDFLAYISEHGSPMDFFSWHSYTTVDKNTRYIAYVKQKLQAAGYENAEIVCNEWNCVPTENKKIDAAYGADQTAMLIMFQNEGLNMAHYYCADASYGMHSGLFVPDKKPSSAYYGFYAFGQLYEMKNQVEIKGSMPKDMYALGASNGETGGLLIANISDKHARRLNINAGEFKAVKCMTVNEECQWVEIDIPKKIPAGTMVYITFER